MNHVRIFIKSTILVILFLSCDNSGFNPEHNSTDLNSVDLSTRASAPISMNLNSIQPIDYYKDLRTKEMVISFFTEITGDRLIAQKILEQSLVSEVDPSLAFALAWGESRFDPLAVNQNRSSVDRGLFQLNNRSFPELKEADFFNMDTNIQNGISYLKRCLISGGNEVVALAMYNAGASRVKERGTPKMTLDYINKIMGYKSKIEDNFHVALLKLPQKGSNLSKAHKKARLLLDRKKALN